MEKWALKQKWALEGLTAAWNRRAEPAPLPVKREKTTVGDYRCPTCGVAFIDGAGTMPYCGNCGQRLEWDEAKKRST